VISVSVIFSSKWRERLSPLLGLSSNEQFQSVLFGEVIVLKLNQGRSNPINIGIHIDPDINESCPYLRAQDTSVWSPFISIGVGVNIAVNLKVAGGSIEPGNT
jgi:hypothetical protein